jgi:hypothetical protein
MAALSGNGWLKTVVAVFILLWIAAAILVARLHRRRGGVWLTGLILGLILGPLEYKRMNFASLARFVGPKRRRGGATSLRGRPVTALPRHGVSSPAIAGSAYFDVRAPYWHRANAQM